MPGGLVRFDVLDGSNGEMLGFVMLPDDLRVCGVVDGSVWGWRPGPRGLAKVLRYQLLR